MHHYSGPVDITVPATFIHVHFIDENFILQSKGLQTLKVPQDDDAVSLLSTMFTKGSIQVT